MKNMEREKFEASWKKALEKAEVTPSDQVWKNIEFDLEKAKGSDLRRRLTFYKLLAAASVIFAMAVGGVGFYNAFRFPSSAVDRLALENDSAHQPSSTSDSQLPVAPDPSLVQPEAETSNRAREENVSRNTDHAPDEPYQTVVPREGEDQTIAENSNSGYRRPASDAGNLNSQSATGEVGTNSQQEIVSLAAVGSGSSHAMRYRTLPPLYTPPRTELTFPAGKKKEVDPVVQMLANLEQRENEIRGDKQNRKEADYDENLWTSVGFAAGSFKSVQSATSGSAPPPSLAMSSLTTPIVDRETSASGYSYSMGVNVGTRLSEKWVLQGGVNYLSQSSEYTANNVVVASTSYQQQRFRAMSTNELINATPEDLNNKIVYAAPYGVNNSMRYLSVPMQAGYLLVNKTFGLQLNAGVATDVFLQNTISADSDHLEKTSQPAGSDSPYRAINLSGLLGTELSYRLGENYRLSLNPGLRYPFNTIYKSELSVQSTPLTFDVGLRFRYIFN